MRPFSQFGLAARAGPLLGSLKKEDGSKEVVDLQGDGRGRVLSPRGTAGCYTMGVAQLCSLSPSCARSCTALWGKPPLHRGRGRSLARLTVSPQLPLQEVGSGTQPCPKCHPPPSTHGVTTGMQLLSCEPGAPRSQPAPPPRLHLPGRRCPAHPGAPHHHFQPRRAQCPGRCSPGGSPPQHPCDGDSKSARRSPTSALSIGSGPPHPAHWRCRRRPPLHKAPFDRASPVGSRGAAEREPGGAAGGEAGAAGCAPAAAGGAGSPPGP